MKPTRLPGPFTTALLLPLSLLLEAPLAAAAAVLPEGPEIQVSVGSASTHSGPQVAVFPDGGFVIAWTVGPLGGGKTVIHAREFAADGTPQTGEFRLIPPATRSQRVNAVAADRDGTFLLAWDEESITDGPYVGPTALYVRRFSRQGAPLGHPILVHAPSPEARFGGRLAIAADGSFAVAWTNQEFGQQGNPFPFPFFDTVARVFHAGGSPAGPEFLVELGDPGVGDNTLNSAPTGVVPLPDGSFVIAFGDFATDVGYAAYLRRFSAAGRTRGPLITLGAESASCEPSDAAVGLAPGGNLVVAWEQHYCGYGNVIAAERFSARFASLGPPSQVSKRIRNEQFFAALAVPPDGGYVVVWAENSVPPGSLILFGRSFAADGTPLSSDFQVYPATDLQWDPAIAATPDGGAVVVWDELSADFTTSLAVFARLLRPR